MGAWGMSGEHGDWEHTAHTSLYRLLPHPHGKRGGEGSMGTRSGEHGDGLQLPHPRYLLIPPLSTCCSNTLATSCSYLSLLAAPTPPGRKGEERGGAGSMGTASSSHTLATSCSHLSLPADLIPSLPPAHTSLYIHTYNLIFLMFTRFPAM
jgi:hypothetical protein